VKETEVWAFSKEAVPELLHDNSDLANLLLTATDKLTIFDRDEA
jgi:hypothetical protein